MSNTVQMQPRRLRVSGSDVTVETRQGVTMLDSLLERGVDYPYGCTTGFCGLCKSHLLSGQVRHLDYLESALSNEERGAGLILPCCAIPESDCVITPGHTDVPLPPVGSIETEIIAMESVTPDVRRVQLRSQKSFDFLAGQYVDLTFEGLPSRQFSMASKPGKQLLEFFIKRVPSGAVTDEGIGRAVVGDRITVRGPFGTGFFRSDDDSPILAVAGGTGIAPILSILSTALDKGMRQEMRLYFGVRTEADLFLRERLSQLAAEHKNLFLSTVLSSPDARSGPWRHGRLNDVLRLDLTGSNISGWRAYVAGAPGMVDAVNSLLESMGLPDSRRHCDPFLTAADLLPR